LPSTEKDQVAGFADTSTGEHAFLYSNGVMMDINNSTLFAAGSTAYGN
jgi:probable HAF family extracellular repeat protein